MRSMSSDAPRRVVRNAAVRMAGEVVAKLASLAFFVVMARELGAGGFGEFQFALALSGALIYLAGFGTDQLLAREVARDRALAGRLLADAAAVKVLGGLLMLGAAALIVNLGDATPDGRAAVYIVGAGALLEVLSKSWHSIFQGYERLDLISATLIVQRTLTAAVGIAVLVSGGGLVAASVVYAAGAAVAVVVCELLLRRLGVRRAPVDASGWLPVMRAGVPIGVVSLLMIVLLRLDVTMLSFLSDAATVGVYAVAFRLVEATQFLGGAMAMAMLPWLARAGANLARGFSLGLKAVNALLLPIGLALVLFARPIVDLLYGSEFERSVVPLQILGLMTLLYGINAYASVSLVARYRPGAYGRLLVPVIALNVVLNLILIPAEGASGAAAAALASGTLLAALALWQARVVLGPADLVGAFAGPVLAGAAMAGVVLALPAPWVVELVLGALVYVPVLVAFEWLARRDDARIYLSALPGSRSRAGRTTA
jgi:O-antigen/teichoic acid export membrane protein